MNVITISGDRQTGKTERAINIMVRRARRGDRVAYVSRRVNSKDVQRRIEERGDYVQSLRGNGQQRVTYPSGGQILFLSTDRNAGRGLTLDAVVLDAGPPSTCTFRARLAGAAVEERMSTFALSLIGSASPTIVQVVDPE